MKWISLIASLIILAIFTELCLRMVGRSTEVIGVWGFVFIFWIFCVFGGLIVFALRLLHILSKNSFIYIFLSVSCLYLGIMGLFLGIGNNKIDVILILAFNATLVLSLIMLTDSFIPNLLFDSNSKNQ